MIWYCINEESSRCEEEEENWIKQIKSKNKNLPIFIILTKGRKENAGSHLLSDLEKLRVDRRVDGIFRVKTEPIKIINNDKAKTPLLEDLINKSTALLPDIAKLPFCSAIESLNLKRKLAKQWLLVYVPTGFVVPYMLATINIPFLNTKMSNLTMQTAMLVHLFIIFELPLEFDTITTLISVGVGCNFTALVSEAANYSGKDILEIIKDAAIEALDDLSLNSFLELLEGEILAGVKVSFSVLVTGLAYIKLITAYKKSCLEGKETSLSELAQDMLSTIVEDHKKQGWKILQPLLDNKELGWQRG